MVNERAGDWSAAHRILFRFAFLYWALFNLPQAGSASLFDALPWGTEHVEAWLAWPLQQVALWVGNHVFHLQGVAATFHETGSGDTALDYIIVLCVAVFAAAGTVLWSVLDRKRLQYRTLDAWLRLLLSFTLALAMLSYGFAKVFPGQFGPLQLGQLNETYGESSPMALLWTFMSGSRWYTMFGGFAEVAPGLLLFFRRTRTIGALVAAAVLVNIVALNLFYDVPVKLYSVHLLVMSLFLAGPDLVGLGKLFFLRRQAQLRTDGVPAVERCWLRRTGYVLQILVIVCAFYTQGWRSYQPYTLPDTKIPLFGLWHVDHATASFTTLPWERVTIQREGNLTVRCNDGSYLTMKKSIDTAKAIITITSPKFGNGLLHYTVDPADPRHLQVSGTWAKGTIAFEMQRVNPDSYLLQTRGFHWISEYPFNR